MVAVLAVVAAACSRGDDEVASTTTVADTTTTIAQLDEGEDPAIDLPPDAGAPLGPYDPIIYSLDIGACFNLYTVALSQTVTEFVTAPACDAPHQNEVYFRVEHPGGPDEPYPGDDAMREWALRRCYEQFESFVGQIYELSSLEIGLAMPPREYWEDSARRFRRVTCWVSGSEDEPLIGSTRGTGR